MKIRIQLKDPDALEDQLGQEIVDNLSIGKTELSNDEVDAVVEKRKEGILELAGTWFEYGEYVTIEIDTDKKTARVVPIKEVNI